MPELNDHSSRAHAVLSPSSAHRWMRCPGSANLAAQYPNVETAYTAEGTLAHEVAEATVSAWMNGTPAKLPDGVPPEMVRHAEGYRDYIAGLSGPETTILLETRVTVPGGFGTADCILLHGSVMDVIDYKYGQGVAVDAVENEQMQLYGLGALGEYGFVYDVETVRLHIYQPRKDNISVWETDVAALEDFGEKAIHLAYLAENEPFLTAGDHCRFCPHAGRCSELAVTSLAAATCKTNTLSPAPDTLTPEAVAMVLKYEPVLSAWLKKVKEQALADMLSGSEVPGYKVVEGRLGNRKWSDEKLVSKALKAAGYKPSEYTQTALLSPSALDKALGKARVEELLGSLIAREPGSPAIAPASDKRAVYTKITDSDFTEV